MGVLQGSLFDRNEMASTVTVRLEYHPEQDRFALVAWTEEQGRRTSATRRLTIAPGGDYGHLPAALAEFFEGYLYDPHFSLRMALSRVITRTSKGYQPDQ